MSLSLLVGLVGSIHIQHCYLGIHEIEKIDIRINTMWLATWLNTNHKETLLFSEQLSWFEIANRIMWCGRNIAVAAGAATASGRNCGFFQIYICTVKCDCNDDRNSHFILCATFKKITVAIRIVASATSATIVIAMQPQPRLQPQFKTLTVILCSHLSFFFFSHSLLEKCSLQWILHSLFKYVIFQHPLSWILIKLCK